MSGVEIRVRSNSSQARNDLNKLEQSVKNIETRTAAAGKAFRNLAIGIGAAFSGGVAVKGINNATDSLTNLENRIALVTGRGKDLDKTMNSLFKIAKKTRGDIGGSADTFNRFGIALRGSGKSSEDLLKAVTSVNKAVAISGSSAESARGALVQLGQGLAAGQLRGEELNSVLEAAPRLAQAIADEMKVPLGAIRKIAEEGKLTTEVVFDALINQAEALSAEFETMEGTSEQAFNVMKDQISRVVAEISKGLGITSTFTNRFNAISDAIEKNRTAIVSGVVGAFQSVGKLFSVINTVATGVISVVAQVVNYIKELAGLKDTKLDMFDTKAFKIAEKSLAAIVGFFAAIKIDASIVKDALDGVAELLTNTFRAIGSSKNDALKSAAKYSRVASDNLKELYKNAVRFSLLKYLEFRGSGGIVQDYRNYLKLIKVQKRVEASTSRMSKSTAEFATKYLSQAWKSVKTFLNLIERKFYWVYDQVIQNSWWTDTMEQTYILAEKWLGKASNSVGKFGDTVSQKFKGVFESFKKGASAFKADLTVSNVKIKFANVKESLTGVGAKIKETATTGLKVAFDSLSSLSPVISASFGAALVAGVTRFLSPDLFKKTFGKIGPAAIAILFAGIATDLADVLKDAGIFSQLGANLGTTLAIAFDAVINAIPVLVDGLIQGVASAGAAFGKSLEGSILGAPAKILSILPGGGLLTSILYGSLGFAVVSSGFRKQLLGLISGVVGRSSSLLAGRGMLQTFFYGENFTRASDKANKAMQRSITLGNNESTKSMAQGAKNASANFTSIANKARVAHLGLVGLFAAGSVALLGDTFGTEISAIIGATTGQIVARLLLTEASVASLSLRFSGLLSAVTTGSVSIFTSVSSSFRAMAVSARASLASINVSSGITAAGISTKFRAAAASAGASFLSLGKVARYGLAGLFASLLFTGAAFADTGDSAASAGMSLLSVAGTIASLALFVPDLTGKLGRMGRVLVDIAGRTKGLALGAAMASGLAAPGIKSKGLDALSVAAGSAVSGATAPSRFSKSIIDGITGGIEKAKGKIGSLLKFTMGATISTAIRSAFLAAFAAVGTLLSAPFLAAAAGVVALGGLAYLAIFGVEETFLARVKKTMGKVARYFDLSSDNSVANGERAQTQGRKLGARKDLSEELVLTLEGITFGSLDDSTAFDISDGLNSLEKLSDRANQERRTLGRVSNSTAAALLNAQNEATAAIIAGNKLKDETDAANKGFATNRLADIVSEAADPSRFEKFTRNIASAITGRDFNSSRIEETRLSNIAEAISDAGFGENDFQTVKALDALVAELTNPDSEVYDSATERRGAFNAFTGFLDENTIAMIGEVADVLRGQLNTDETGRMTTVGPGLDPALLNALFAALAEANDNRDIVGLGDSNEAAQNLRATIDKNEEETFRRTKGLNDSLISAALSAQGFSTSLELLSQLSTRESEDITFLQNALDQNKFDIDKALTADRQAGNKAEEFTAGVNLNIALENKRMLELELATVVRDALDTGFDTLPISRIAASLTRSGISESISEQISKGLQFGVSTLSAIKVPEASDVKSLADELERVNSLISEQNRLSSDQKAGDYRVLDPVALETALSRQKEITAQIDAMAFALSTLEVESSEVESLVELGAGFSNIENIDMDKLFKLDPATATRVAQLAAAMTLLKSAAQNPVLASTIGLDNDAIVAQFETLQSQIDKAFKPAARTAPTGGSKDTETLFEKFVGGLNASGFNLDIEQAAGLGRNAINSLQGPLKAIKDAQDRITKASLSDNTARSASLAIIKKQREAIASILTAGTVGQANIGLEGLGVDPNLATNAANTESLLKISGLQSDLNETLFTDYATRKDITSEILNQQRLLEGLTSGAEASTAAVKDSLKESLSGLLKGTMSAEDAIMGVLDTLSSNIIDTVVDSFIESMFQAAGLKDMFDGLFAGLFSGGDSLGKEVGGKIGESITGALGKSAGDGSGGLFASLGKGFTGLLSSLGEGLSGIFSSIGSIFSGGASGGGFFSGLMSIFSGAPGMSQGGTVRSTPYSQVGKDSVPTMLMPGEVVSSKSAVSRMGDNGGGSTQSFNINVSGDVSRQTRKEIVKMLPQIASGVNSQNKENNYRGR
jgi:tape measure domain-containing protein